LPLFLCNLCTFREKFLPLKCIKTAQKHKKTQIQKSKEVFWWKNWHKTRHENHTSELVNSQQIHHVENLNFFVPSKTFTNSTYNPMPPKTKNRGYAKSYKKYKTTKNTKIHQNVKFSNFFMHARISTVPKIVAQLL
jgi:nicotinamidase-related amidase